MESFSAVQGEGLLAGRPEALGQHEAARCANALRAGDLVGCHEAFSAAQGWEAQWFCLEYVAEQANEPGSQIDRLLIDAWVDGWPDHPVPLMMRAAIDAFGHGDAAADVDRILARDAGNALVYGLQVVDGAGASVGELEGPLGSMLGIEPLYEPHVRFMRSLGAANGDEMLAFARAVDETVVSGSPLRALLPLASIELLVAEQPPDHLAWFDERGLRSRIMMAAGQSVFHPDFGNAPAVPAIKAMTAFLVSLELLGEDDLSLMLHDRLDGVFADWPFSLLAPPTTASWLDIGRHMMRNAPAAAAAGQRI